MNNTVKKTTHKMSFPNDSYVSTRIVRVDERVKLIKRITKITKSYETLERLNKLITDKVVRIEGNMIFGTYLSDIKKSSKVCTTQVQIMFLNQSIEITTFIHIWNDEYRFTHL